jgi:hypothetical protein
MGDEPTLQKYADGAIDIDTNNHWAACYNTVDLLTDQDASVPLAEEIEG